MSTEPAEKPTTSTRSRSNRKNRSKGGAKKERVEKGEEEDGTPRAEKVSTPKPPRPESLLIPAELVDTTCTGTITAIIRRGRLKFGFIHLGDPDASTEDVPRVYFSFSELADTASTVRKGYHVQFTCKTDEKSRQFAADISLTEAGAVLAAEREKSSQEKLKTSTEPKKEKSPRKERKPLEERNVTLDVTCEGTEETKTVVFNVNQSLGRLKNLATTAFDAPITYNVFLDGVFLTKPLLTEQVDKQVDKGTPIVISLAAPKEEEAAATEVV